MQQPQQVGEIRSPTHTKQHNIAINTSTSPTQLGKENNNIITNSYKSPPNAMNISNSSNNESVSLSSVESAASAPLTSVKMNMMMMNEEGGVLLSPLSPVTICSSSSPINYNGKKIDVNNIGYGGMGDGSMSSEHVEEEEGEGSNSDISSSSSLDESNNNCLIKENDDDHDDNFDSDIESKDTTQIYGDEGEDDESEEDDEDYSINDDVGESDVDDEDDTFEFDEELSDKKKKKRKGGNKMKNPIPEKEEGRSAAKSNREGSIASSVGDNNTPDSTNDNSDDGNSNSNCSTDESEETGTSSPSALKGCKVKLNDILGSDKEENLSDSCTQNEDMSDEDEHEELADNDTECFPPEKVDSIAKSQTHGKNSETETQESDAQQQTPMEADTSKMGTTESNIPTISAAPSTHELHYVVDTLFREADKDTVTVKDIVRSVGNHFNLSKVEKAMKKVIKARLTDLIQGNVEVKEEPAPETNINDVDVSSVVTASNDASAADETNMIANDTSIQQKVDESQSTQSPTKCKEDEYDVSSELPQSPVDVSFGESGANSGFGDDDVVMDDDCADKKKCVGNDNVAVEKTKYVLCPQLSSADATKHGEASTTEINKPMQHEGSPPVETKDIPQPQPASKYRSPPPPQTSELPVIAEEVTNCNDSAMSDTLFQNLSPIKSPVPVSQSGVDSLSMSNSFGDSMKTRNVVEKGKWSLGSEIGRGTFGRVYMGMNAISGSIMAVKVLQIPDDNKRAIVEDLQREIDLMKSLKHPNIVRYLGAEVDSSKNILHIFQEWAPGGSISALLKKFGTFPINVVKSYVTQALIGLDYLHSHGIIHRDIKGGNILVSNDGAIKLADFGASKRVEALDAESDEMELTMRGTPYFMAPEVFEEKYGAKADIWSVGGVIYQMVTGSPPWKDMGFKSPIALFMHLKNHSDPPKLPQLKNCDEHDYILLERILTRCYQRDPSMRPSASTLRRDNFLTGDDSIATPTSPNLLLSPSGAEFIISPRSAFKSPSPTLDEIPENEELECSLADSLCYSLTLKSPLKMNTKDITKDTSEWPSWAKQALLNKEKENASTKSEGRQTNPYARKKSPFAKAQMNIEGR